MLTSVQFTPTSTLESLPSFAFEVDGATTQGRAVVERFANNPELPGVLITLDSVPTAVISRFRFDSFMNRAYSKEIYSKRPLTVLLETVKAGVLIFPSSTLIKEATLEALKREEELFFDPIVVQLGDGSRKLVDVRELLRATFQALNG
ncbi:MAG: hypothetical protein RMK91_00690 [Pseudanabaenaceae cyanobacterium SKYGB_i_bin29]|nr:hypothetical protein [Pseudanabaenaceae cyanobacterium SKYG29]MDW8420368.1 hypothetical protein [Pseudanabaenaceae cyanobacterium SKYGB_i_bin29]